MQTTSSPRSSDTVHRHLHRGLWIILAGVLILLIVTAILVLRAKNLRTQEINQDAVDVQAVFDVLNANPQPEMTEQELADVYTELNAPEQSTSTDQDIDDVFEKLNQ